MPDQKGRFLWGAVRTEANANTIVAVTSWIFIGFGALCFLAFLVPSGRGMGTGILVSALLAAPAGFLLTRKSRAAATVLLLVAGLPLLIMIFAFTMAQIQSGFLNVGEDMVLLLPLIAFWTPLIWLCWRALRATRFLRAQIVIARRTAAIFDEPAGGHAGSSTITS